MVPEQVNTPYQPGLMQHIINFLLPAICLGWGGVDAVDQMNRDKITMSEDHQNRSRNGDLNRAEQSLRAPELSRRRRFEAAQDGILVLDLDTGCINDVNTFPARLLCLSRDQMVAKTAGEV